MEQKVIDIGAQFSRYPAGRFRDDGPYSGERFRDEVLLPALRSSGSVLIKLDGAMGYGSSFLEEVFGGIVRSRAFTPEQLRSMIKLESTDGSLIDEIYEYISSTVH